MKTSLKPPEVLRTLATNLLYSQKWRSAGGLLTPSPWPLVAFPISPDLPIANIDWYRHFCGRQPLYSAEIGRLGI
jgi:hypothetical protein